MILITGGAGYIGSHLIIELIKQNKKIIVIDNFTNSSGKNLTAINRLLKVKIKFIKCDLLDKKKLNKVFQNNSIKTIFHLAGLTSISESINEPLKYYDNNVSGTVNLLYFAKKHKITRIIYSSSAAVYGSKCKVPYKEEDAISFGENPYAMTKLMSERLLQDFVNTNKLCKIAILRYFNPIGMHKSCKIGYNHKQSSNLIPNIIRVLLKKDKVLKVYGGNFKTQDGTGVRDYIHIDDLIEGHLSALQNINKNNGFNIWNLGRGNGYSVLEVVKMFEKILCTKVNYNIENQRLGDIPQFWCSTSKSNRELKWKANKDLEDMIKDEINSLRYLNKNFKKKIVKF